MNKFNATGEELKVRFEIGWDDDCFSHSSGDWKQTEPLENERMTMDKLSESKGEGCIDCECELLS